MERFLFYYICFTVNHIENKITAVIKYWIHAFPLFNHFHNPVFRVDNSEDSLHLHIQM